MRELLRFEFRRNIKFIIVFISLIAVIGPVLCVIDKDTEELVISLSVLLVLLPYAVIALSLVRSIVEDAGGKTKHLYLSLPKSRSQIIAAKFIYAFICFFVYFISIMLAPYPFMYVAKQLSTLLYIILFGLALELTALFVIFGKKTTTITSKTI